LATNTKGAVGWYFFELGGVVPTVNAGSLKSCGKKTLHGKGLCLQLLVDGFDFFSAKQALYGGDYLAGQPRILGLDVGNLRFVSHISCERLDPAQVEA
jgi:hypothetical protein